MARVLETFKACWNFCGRCASPANFPSIILWILKYLGLHRNLVSTVLLVVASTPRSLGERSFLCEMLLIMCFIVLPAAN